MTRRYVMHIAMPHPIPTGAPYWTVDPASSGLSWLGWGALLQIGADDAFGGTLQGGITNPPWKAAIAQAFLDSGCTWAYLELNPGLIRTDADYFTAWINAKCPYSAGQAGVNTFYEMRQHRFYPIESGYVWGQPDFRMTTVGQEIVSQAAARGITVHFGIKMVDAYPNGSTIAPYNVAPAGSYAMKDFPSRYAALVTALWQHIFNTYSISMESLDNINEPGYAGSTWTITQQAAAAAAAHAALETAGFSGVKIFTPSFQDAGQMTASAFNTFYNSDAGSWRSVWRPSTHTYGFPTPTNLADVRTRLGTLKTNVSTQAQGWVNTEYQLTPFGLITAIVYGDLRGSMNYSLAYVDLYTDMTAAYNVHAPSSTTVSKRTHMIGLYPMMTAIREGHIRLTATKTNITDADNAELVAYKNPSNGKLSGVLVSHSTGERYVTGLQAGSYKVTYQLGSESSPFAGSSRYTAGAADLSGRYWAINGPTDSIHLTIDTAGAAGTYAFVQQ